MTANGDNNVVPVVPLEAIGADHLYRDIITSGEIGPVEEPKVRLVRAAFECHRCGAMEMVAQSSAEDFTLAEVCEECGSSDYDLSPADSKWTDYQEFSLREHGVDEERPRRRIRCHAEGDLVGHFEEGAFVSLRIRPVTGTQIYSVFDLLLEVIGVEAGVETAMNNALEELE